MVRCRRAPLVVAVGLVLAAPFASQAQDIDLGSLGDGGFAMQGAAEFDYSGISVSGAGDVNGDGLADVIVGAHGADPAGISAAGKSYVVFGKPSVDPVALADLDDRGFAIEGGTLFGRSGFSVSGAGDVNGDGLADLIVGVYDDKPPGDSAADIGYVVFGKSSGVPVTLTDLGERGFEIRGASVQDRLGISVSGAGDVNGDGLADLIVGDRTEAGGGRPEAGTSYVVFGKAGRDAVDLGSLGEGGFAIEGAAADDRSGVSVSGAGDVNGDGLADLIVGADGADSGGALAAGTSYVVFGKTGSGRVDLANLGAGGFAIRGVAQTDFSGRSVSGAGDVNGDGLADLIIGAERADPGGESSAGSSYVVFGKSDARAIELATLGADGFGFTIEGVSAADRAGGSVSGAGDLNGDGLADLIVGADGVDRGSDFSVGTSYVVFGKTGGGTVDLSNLDTRGFAVQGASAGDQAGRSVAAAGDVNGDGLADLIVGADGVDAGGAFNVGAGYVIFSSQVPSLFSAYRTYARNGDAPRRGVGITGDGSNDDSPDSRVWLDFDNGSEFGTDASLQEVILRRNSGPYGEAAANVHWEIGSSRSGWSGAELTVRYTDAELFTADEAALRLVQAPAATGPYTVLPSVVNPDDNTLSAIVDELGFFFITEAPGEVDLDVIFAGGFE